MITLASNCLKSKMLNYILTQEQNKVETDIKILKIISKFESLLMDTDTKEMRDIISPPSELSKIEKTCKTLQEYQKNICTLIQEVEYVAKLA